MIISSCGAGCPCARDAGLLGGGHDGDHRHGKARQYRESIGDRPGICEMKIYCSFGVSIPAHYASKFTSKQSSLHALVVQREGSKKGFPYLLGT